MFPYIVFCEIVNIHKKDINIYVYKNVNPFQLLQYFLKVGFRMKRP